MTKELLDKLNELKQGYLEALTGFVAIPSYYDETAISDEHPFGKNVTDALNYMCALAHQYNLDVINYDNKVVEITVGEGEKDVTILGHVDVVPPSVGQEEPFVIKEEDGVVYGRGVSDDKGPLLSAFFALVALKELNLIGNHQVRLICGGNEESGSLCMKYYFGTLNKKEPTIGFTPDSNFPLIFAEKGIINFSLSKKVAFPGIISVEGGNAINAVIDSCVVKVELNSEVIPLVQSLYPETEIFTRDDIVTLTFKGVAAHSSTPNKGENAGTKALQFLAKYLNNPRLTEIEYRYCDIYAKALHCNDFNMEMGQNTLNLGIISYKDGLFSLSFNFRYINTTDVKEIKDNFAFYSNTLTCKILDEHPLIYFPKDSLLVQTLLSSYQNVTGDKVSQPIAIGGGTYAKEASNIVAFGAEFNDFDTYMHSKDERARLSDLYKAMDIYAEAIVNLGALIDANKI